MRSDAAERLTPDLPPPVETPDPRLRERPPDGTDADADADSGGDTDTARQTATHTTEDTAEETGADTDADAEAEACRVPEPPD